MNRIVGVGFLMMTLFLFFEKGHAKEGAGPDLLSAGIDQKLDQGIPLETRFQDEQGRELPLSAFFQSRPVILVPTYYGCPMLCAQILKGLVGGLKGMSLSAGSDFQVIAISFDPSDTPEEAAKHKRDLVRRYHRNGGEMGWHLLTGTESSIHKVMDSIGYRYSYDPKTREYIHAAGLVILTPSGRIARYLFGIDFAPRDLRLGLVEASSGRIGTAIDRLLLFCYHYDPTRGKYGAQILAALQIGGVLTLTGLAGLIAGLLYRERGARRLP